MTSIKDRFIEARLRRLNRLANPVATVLREKERWVVRPTNFEWAKVKRFPTFSGAKGYVETLLKEKLLRDRTVV